jgi:hypothetical protein
MFGCSTSDTIGQNSAWRSRRLRSPGRRAGPKTLGGLCWLLSSSAVFTPRRGIDDEGRPSTGMAVTEPVNGARTLLVGTGVRCPIPW